MTEFHPKHFGLRPHAQLAQILESVYDLRNTEAGAAAGTGVTASEQGVGQIQKTVLTLVDTPVTLTDQAGTVAYGGVKVYDFPAGLITYLGATADLAVTKSSTGVNADWDGDFALGTATASNNATLTSTEANIVPSTATPQASGGATTAKGKGTTVSMIDGTGTAVDLYANFLVDDADHNVAGTACNLVLNGTITIVWANCGDYAGSSPSSSASSSPSTSVSTSPSNTPSSSVSTSPSNTPSTSVSSSPSSSVSTSPSNTPSTSASASPSASPSASVSASPS